ncbi:hypothetical protein PSYPI_49507, partial [Pseudomonas syringae pv. pisi str. 1704B]
QALINEWKPDAIVVGLPLTTAIAIQDIPEGLAI